MGAVVRSEQRMAGPECLGGIADFNGECLVSRAEQQQTTATQPWESSSQAQA